MSKPLPQVEKVIAATVGLVFTDEGPAADLLRSQADEIERLRDAGRYLVTALGGAADRGGWTRKQILAVFKDACERWPELDPRKARDDA